MVTSGLSAGKKFRYEKIADFTIGKIENGSISCGEKLPSLREMSARFGCSISVVRQAYEELEIRGRIRAVEKSGYFVVDRLETPGFPVPSPRAATYSLQPEYTRPLSVIGRIIDASNDPEVVPLGAGLPHESLLPLAALKRSLVRVARNELDLYRKYTPEGGSPALRLRIAEYMAARGVEVGPEDVVITNGCTEALVLSILACSRPGDTLAVESPMFLGTIQILHELDRKIIPIPTSAVSGMDLDALESILISGDVSAVVGTAIHQNPLGFVMSERNRRRAAGLATSHGVPFIEDDIYSDCSFSGEIHRPIKSFDGSGDVMYCSSFSKTIGAGMRIGWLIPGKRLRSAASLKTALTLGGSPLAQEAMADFLSDLHYRRYIRNFRKMLAAQASAIAALIRKHFPPDIAMTSPGGGYHYWVELPPAANSLEVFERCLLEGISVAPGSAFASGNRYTNCLRLSYGSPVTEATRNGIEILGRIISGMA